VSYIKRPGPLYRIESVLRRSAKHAPIIGAKQKENKMDKYIQDAIIEILTPHNFFSTDKIYMELKNMAAEASIPTFTLEEFNRARTEMVDRGVIVVTGHKYNSKYSVEIFALAKEEKKPMTDTEMVVAAKTAQIEGIKKILEAKEALRQAEDDLSSTQVSAKDELRKRGICLELSLVDRQDANSNDIQKLENDIKKWKGRSVFLKFSKPNRKGSITFELDPIFQEEWLKLIGSSTDFMTFTGHFWTLDHGHIGTILPGHIESGKYSEENVELLKNILEASKSFNGGGKLTY
jgi:hypothetical protein